MSTTTHGSLDRSHDCGRKGTSRWRAGGYALRTVKDVNGYGADPGITDEISDALEHAFQVGAVVKDAAAYAGISTRTLERWLTRGHRGEEPYAELASRLDRARGAGNIHSLNVLQRSDDWRAHRARLAFQNEGYVERRFIEKQVNHKHEIDLSALSLDDLRALREILARAGGDEMIEDAEVLELEEAV